MVRREAGLRDTQVLREMKRRPVCGARMLGRDEKPAEVACTLEFSRQSVMVWEKSLAESGSDRIAKVGRRGGHFASFRGAGEGVGDVAQARSVRRRVCNRDLDDAVQRSADREAFWREIVHCVSAMDAAEDGLEPLRANRQSTQAQRASDRGLEEQEVRSPKKSATRQRRFIVFMGESRHSEHLCRAGTWAPKGETSAVKYTVSWKQLSVIAGTGFVRLCVRDTFWAQSKLRRWCSSSKPSRGPLGRSSRLCLQARRSRLVREPVE